MRRRATWATRAAALAAAALAVAVAAAPAGAAGPSGLAMPVGDLAGWTQTMTEDFPGTTLDEERWQRYLGVPGGDPFGWFDPSHLSVGGGELVIDGYRDAALGGKWATGGVATQLELAQTYGKYLVRMRFDRGVGVNHALLLWPADESWPPEVDFGEDDGHGGRYSHATLHYGAQDSMIHRRVRVDLRRWHTIGVEWTPGRVAYTLDGRTWATVTSAHVPSQPMKLAIQTQAWGCGMGTWEGCVGATTPKHVRLEVDWVVTYALRGAEA
jgi:beta-glucanase (GH16 family)